MQYLIVVDMQKDFIDGALGTPEAQAILPRVLAEIRCFQGETLFTRDTHAAAYLQTQEGQNLPVAHCIKDTPGWQLHPAIAALASPAAIIDKPTFGSVTLGERLAAAEREAPVERITLVGLCTDICVISNALLIKAFLPETPIRVIAACCAGVTPESHARALAAMQVCQIEIA